MAPISLSSSTSSPEVVEGDLNGSLSSLPAKMVSTTTISTIAVQSGSTRIIIAILRAGIHITIKVDTNERFDANFQVFYMVYLMH